MNVHERPSRTVDRALVDNGDGFRLAVRRIRGAGPLRPHPVLIVPGYGMNSFVFGHHPTGLSLEESLVARGFEVWTAELRGQGQALRVGGRSDISLYDLSVVDLGAVLRHVLATTETREGRVDLVGCSLGAALAFAHVAHNREAPVRAIASVAGVVTWHEVHPLLRVAFASERLAGMVRLKHTRRIARHALPVVAAVAPSLLSLYLNVETTDLSAPHLLVQTVEDPVPSLNREIARWIQRRDLVVAGTNVSAALASMTYPHLCIVPMQDGIVPPATARASYDAIGSAHKELVCVGTGGEPFAHADVFVGRRAEELVFAPLADFLARCDENDVGARSA